MSNQILTLATVTGLAMSSAGAASLPIRDDDGCRSSIIETTFEATGTTFTCALECAITYAGTTRYLLGDCCTDGSLILDTDACAECDTDGLATCSASVSNAPTGVAGQCRWQSTATASASARCVSTLVELETSNTILHCGSAACCSDDEIYDPCENISLAWAVAVASADFTAAGSWNYAIDTGGLYYDDEGLIAGFKRRIRGVIYVPTSGSPSSMGLIEMPAGEELRGVSINMDNEITGTLTGTGGSGSQSAKIYSGTFEVDAWDLDGDGRFNEIDAAILDSVVGTGDDDDPLYVPMYDIDNSGHIEAVDADFFLAVVEAEFDSGILGDLDGDGDTDCDDFDVMGSSWNYTIGDMNYRVEADADLDGDNDTADYDAVYEILQPADTNNDGTVNTQDLTLFQNWWTASDPRADINGDGTVNSADYLAYLNLWNNPC